MQRQTCLDQHGPSLRERDRPGSTGSPSDHYLHMPHGIDFSLLCMQTCCLLRNRQASKSQQRPKYTAYYITTAFQDETTRTSLPRMTAMSVMTVLSVVSSLCMMQIYLHLQLKQLVGKGTTDCSLKPRMAFTEPDQFTKASADCTVCSDQDQGPVFQV